MNWASAAQFTPVLQALQRWPARLAALARLPAYTAQPVFLNQAFQTLYGAGDGQGWLAALVLP